MALDPTLNYWIARGDQTFGPYSADEVLRYIDSGHIANNDRVRSDRDVEWSSVQTALAPTPLTAPAEVVVATAPAAIAVDESARPLAITAVVLGVVGIFIGACIPAVLSVAGIIVAIMALSRADSRVRSMALTGLVLNIVGFVVGTCAFAALLAMLVSIAQAAQGLNQ